MKLKNKTRLQATGYKLHDKKGFTLIELLIVLAIFSTTSILAAGIFVSAFNLEKRTAAFRAVQHNASFLLEYLGKEIRNGEIYYAAYPDATVPDEVSTLYVLYRGSGYREKIYLQEGRIKIARETEGSINWEDPGQASDLTSADVVVESLKFYVEPSTKCGESDCGGQQRVTVLIKIKSNTNLPVNVHPINMDLQTTYSVRIYDL